MQEKNLINKCKKYLKEMYDEDTEWMKVIKNEVKEGTGILSIDCKVTLEGESSCWNKKFEFEKGKIIDMQARRK